MSDLQTAVDALMNLVLYGGAEAAKQLFMARVGAGTQAVRDTWRGVFEQAPDAYPLADRVARNPTDPDLDADLRALLVRVLREHPELLPAGGLAVQTGDIRAEHGSVAVGAMQGGSISIKNSK
ncbi:hypothetical protein [uncultured Thiodictyon sp.]|jgi:hypothetical protein|uniref:hypothetical protein n=1 Tax=uncultured Thiodictyon sp. TaxID=1846217 RepID=UPI0025E81E49|nr:hypothetical protein [uncultured Thiodictyon sp.]